MIFGNTSVLALEMVDATRVASVVVRFIRMRIWIAGKSVGDFEHEDLLGSAIVDINSFLRSSACVALPDDAPRDVALLPLWIMRQSAHVLDDDGADVGAWDSFRRSVQFAVYSVGSFSTWMILVIPLDGQEHIIAAKRDGNVVSRVQVPPGTFRTLLEKALATIDEGRGLPLRGTD